MPPVPLVPHCVSLCDRPIQKHTRERRQLIAKNSQSSAISATTMRSKMDENLSWRNDEVTKFYRDAYRVLSGDWLSLLVHLEGDRRIYRSLTLSISIYKFRSELPLLVSITAKINRFSYQSKEIAYRLTPDVLAWCFWCSVLFEKLETFGELCRATTGVLSDFWPKIENFTVEILLCVANWNSSGFQNFESSKATVCWLRSFLKVLVKTSKILIKLIESKLWILKFVYEIRSLKRNA